MDKVTVFQLKKHLGFRGCKRTGNKVELFNTLSLWAKENNSTLERELNIILNDNFEEAYGESGVLAADSQSLLELTKSGGKLHNLSVGPSDVGVFSAVDNMPLGSSAQQALGGSVVSARSGRSSKSSRSSIASMRIAAEAKRAVLETKLKRLSALEDLELETIQIQHKKNRILIV